jgi:hypothetical protein
VRATRLIAIVCFLAGVNVRATRIDVYQGLLPDPSTYKGTIEAYSGTDPAALNYDYFSHSAHPTEGPNLRFNRGEIFFYDGPEGTTFNVIFNKEKKAGDPETAGKANWNIAAASSVGDPSVLLSDDNNELKEDATFFKGRWEWHNNTDGGIIQGLIPFWILAIDPKLYEGLDSLKVFSANNDRLNMNLRTGDRGYMWFVVSVPDGGSTLSLFSAGLAGLAVLSIRKRKSVG